MSIRTICEQYNKLRKGEEFLGVVGLNHLPLYSGLGSQYLQRLGCFSGLVIAICSSSCSLICFG